MRNEKSLKFNPMLTVIITILFLVVLIYLFSKESVANGAEKIKRLRKTIKEDISKLNLITEKRYELTKKARKLFDMAISIAVLGFVSSNVFLIYIGVGFLQALEGTTMFVGVFGTITSIYLLNKISINELFGLAESTVVFWVFKWFKFDAHELLKLENRINENNLELNKLQKSIN